VAGMEAARIAALRGHEVTLYEKTNNLGGHLIEACVPDFKDDYKALLNWYRRQLSGANVDIQTETTVTDNLVRANNPDVVIIATGSSPLIPQIPGVHLHFVTTVIDVLLKRTQPGNKVLVVGGGLAGCEAALWMAEKGKDVTIVEALPEVATNILYANRSMLLHLLAANGVKIMTDTRLKEITDGFVTLMCKSGPVNCTFDTVVLACGMKTERSLYNALSSEIPEIYSVGDCNEPRKIMDAIWDGFNVGRII